MTPEEFKVELVAIYDATGGYEEVFHIRSDALIMKLLKELGYGDVAEFFDKADEWYS